MCDQTAGFLLLTLAAAGCCCHHSGLGNGEALGAFLHTVQGSKGGVQAVAFQTCAQLQSFRYRFSYVQEHPGGSQTIAGYIPCWSPVNETLFRPPHLNNTTVSDNQSSRHHHWGVCPSCQVSQSRESCVRVCAPCASHASHATAVGGRDQLYSGRQNNSPLPQNGSAAARWLRNDMHPTGDAAACQHPQPTNPWHLSARKSRATS